MTARRSLLLWFGVFAAPLAWFLQLLIGWMFEEAACSDGSRRWWSGEHWWQVGLSAAALVVGLLGTLAALASLRASRRGELPDPRGRVFFLTVLGLSASLFFLALAALTGTYVIILDPCTAG